MQGVRQISVQTTSTMPRIKTERLLERIAKGEVQTVKLKGLQGGLFCMLLECADGIFIHENSDGTMKEYPKVDFALVWLKRKTDIKEVTIDIELWQQDAKT
jgi:hypothetical protein